MSSLLRFVLLLSWVGALALPEAEAARISDVRNTKHNLSTTSSTDTRTITAAGQTEICVFCHTPHGANTSAAAPLWNRRVGGASNTETTYTATYTPYSSESLDARSVQAGWSGQPLGSSKLCLSCHDGTIALGNVVNAPGSGLGTVAAGGFGRNADGAGGLSTTTMPAGTEGYTRNLGQNLANDHPISITYNTALTNQDGELRKPDTMLMINTSHPLVGVRGAGQGSGISNLARSSGAGSTRPVLPLEPTGSGGAGQVQCTTCHDPHIRETSLTTELNIKFLRRNRFQLNSGPGATYSDTNDIMCLACHEKGHDGTGPNAFSWAYSAHANEAVAGQAYTATATTLRQFPANIKVWQAACLNCHDTHTVTGANRLTRAGAVGGVSKLEETCYQCHSSTTILQDVTSVPNIATDFGLSYKMPIADATEVHDIGGHTAQDCAGGLVKCGADGVESQTKLVQRHAECTDCHNPHRVVRLHRYDGKVEATGVFTAGINPVTAQTDKEGTHYHVNTTGYTHNNVASGVLRGSWGVEPVYTYTDSSKFNTNIPQSSYTVRRGDPGSNSLSAAEVAAGTDSKTYVTREYQVCLKCHSSYAYGNNPPTTGPSIGQNGLQQYTDQAREFHAPAGHNDESTSGTCPSSTCIELGAEAGADAAWDRHNHRSWHPVMKPTGRTTAKRGGIGAGAWRTPWNNAVGTQTMYCSDCHGSSTGTNATVIPNLTDPATGAGSPWGPHGSANPFILKGTWTNDSGSGDATTVLCLKCHNTATYTSSSDQGDLSSAFCCGSGDGNLHNLHQNRISGDLDCTWCHVAVPHGWKNKSLLVNLNDVGPEAGQTGSKEVKMESSGDYYTQPPYYLEAKLKIRNFARPGQWAEGSCGSVGKTGANAINPTNRAVSDANNRTTGGLSWMTDGACDSGIP